MGGEQWAVSPDGPVGLWQVSGLLLWSLRGCREQVLLPWDAAASAAGAPAPGLYEALVCSHLYSVDSPGFSR